MFEPCVDEHGVSHVLKLKEQCNVPQHCLVECIESCISQTLAFLLILLHQQQVGLEYSTIICTVSVVEHMT
jgi:hypothetical protein